MKMPKWLILAVLCLLLTACASEAEVPTVATAPTAATVPATQPETQPETVPETEPPEEHFTLTFVGDCTLGSNPSNTYAQSGFVRTVGEDYDYPLKNVVDIFSADETQTELGRMAIDAGADIVWGSHPHLLQPVEAYNGGWIFYSLGNFCFGGNGAPPDLDSAVLQLEVIRSADGTVRLGELTVIPVSISSVEKVNNFQPTPYPEDSEEYLRVHSKLDGTWPIAHIPINKGI